MALRPSSVPLPPPPESSLPAVPDPESDRACAASPTVSCLLASIVTGPSFESTATSALVAELVDFAAAYRLDYATALVAEQEDLDFLAATVPRFASMLLAPEGDPVAPDIPTPRSYAEAIKVPYSSQWQTAMDAEMASWKSTCTYVDAVPLSRANMVDGMWIFRVKRPPGSPPAFKARYVARCFIYGLRQAPREWQDTLRTTLATLGFTPSIVDPSLFLRTDTSLLPLYVLVYVDDLVFATADTEALTLVKSELQKRHSCTDLGELHSYLGLQITRDRARRTIILTQSHMMHQVLQRFGFQFSSPQPTPLSTGHSLSAPPSDESVEPSGPYPALVGYLMYLMTCTRPDLAYPLSLLARSVAPGRHRKVHWDAAKRVLRYLCSTSGMGLVLGGRGPVVLTGHADASWVDDSATQRSSHGYTFSLGSGSVSWRSTRSSLVLGSSCEAKIYAGAMAAHKLRWLTHLLTDLGEQPRSPPVLYVDNKAMIALCQEHRLEHRTKHIALRYFLARELQQRGQLRLAYVATRANTADILTKALPPGDHRRCSTVLGLVPTLPHLLTVAVTSAVDGSKHARRPLMNPLEGPSADADDWLASPYYAKPKRGCSLMAAAAASVDSGDQNCDKPAHDCAVESMGESTASLQPAVSDRRFSCSAVTPAGLAAGKGIAIGGGGAAAAAAAAALSAAVAAAAAASGEGGSAAALRSPSAGGSGSAELRPPAALFSVAEGFALAAAPSSSALPAQKSPTGAVAAGARDPAAGRAARTGVGGGGDCNRGGGRGMARTAETAEFDLSVPAKARKSMSGSGRRASLDYSDLQAVRERVQQAAALWALAEDRERENGNQGSDTDDDDEASSSSARGEQQGKSAAALHQGSDLVQQQQHHKSSSTLASQSHPQGGGAAAEAGNQGRAEGPSRSKAGARGSLIRRWLNFGRS
ncbi:unnamed protein product [Closterium sp. NIES-54]